jgi:predicted XRE-type DNA-binding protein
MAGKVDREVWRWVRGYRGKYMVSTYGRIKSVGRWKSRIRKLVTLKNGYSTVILSKNGKVRCCYVHRLVAQAFIPNPLTLPEVNHKDFDRENNYVGNLEWMTELENHQHAKEHGRSTYGEGHANARLSTKQVKQIRKLYDTGRFYQKELGHMFGVRQSHISDIVTGKRWACIPTGGCK